MNAKKREPGHAEISTGRWAVVVFRAYEHIMVMFNCCVVIRGCKQLFLKCRPTMAPFSIRVFPCLSLSLPPSAASPLLPTSSFFLQELSLFFLMLFTCYF